ncbi:hypothetical protein DPMN_107190 [Dreissena polymorpha]|uniref:Uncharacterized protein n=1 Tax=Dreissena polymorpha TaxID=45954 RepID=A0A9D4K6J5_DREPO|nr:hypothetical protein DPMN_107190 [Dreissena polymorpha]
MEEIVCESKERQLCVEIDCVMHLRYTCIEDFEVLQRLRLRYVSNYKECVPALLALLMLGHFK